MNKLKLVISLGLVIGLSSVQAADTKNGKLMHDKSCTACHIAKFGKDGSEIYTRIDRRINDYSSLVKRVKGCNVNTKAGFSASDVENVIEYLNSAFYKFKK